MPSSKWWLHGPVFWLSGLLWGAVAERVYVTLIVRACALETDVDAAAAPAVASTNGVLAEESAAGMPACLARWVDPPQAWVTFSPVDSNGLSIHQGRLRNDLFVLDVRECTPERVVQNIRRVRVRELGPGRPKITTIHVALDDKELADQLNGLLHDEVTQAYESFVQAMFDFDHDPNPTGEPDLREPVSFYEMQCRARRARSHLLAVSCLEERDMVGGYLDRSYLAFNVSTCGASPVVFTDRTLCRESVCRQQLMRLLRRHHQKRYGRNASDEVWVPHENEHDPDVLDDLVDSSHFEGDHMVFYLDVHRTKFDLAKVAVPLRELDDVFGSSELYRQLRAMKL